MAAQYTKVKKFAGVYYSESIVNKFRGKPDRTYWINFRDFATKKLQWKQVGKASEGWTPERAQRFRIEQMELNRVGKYKSASQLKIDAITFDDFMRNHYFPWADKQHRRPRENRSRYDKWLKKELAALQLSQILATHIDNVLSRMRETGLAISTQNHMLKLIRQAFKKANEWNIWKGPNPCDYIKLPKDNNARQRFLSHEEARTLLTALAKKSKQTAQIATLSLYSGMRLGEIFALKWSDVDFEHGIITILDSKNGESRPVFVTEPIKAILAELAPGPPGSNLFTTSDGGSIQFLSNSFGRAVDEIGLNNGITDRRQKVTFHTLRHTYASWAVMAGVPLYQVGKALGHKSTAMTERYSHLAPDSQRLVFEAVALHAENSLKQENGSSK